jgi:MerR family transcriptional regulator, light-induced transcriptional regulator
MTETHQCIKVVAKRTGLSPHVIRIWEKRYAAVQPVRTETNRRLYTEDQIERLNLLRRLTHAGHSIGTVAHLPVETLRALAAEAANGYEDPTTRSRAPSVDDPAGEFLAECVMHIKATDAHALEDVLARATMLFGAQGVLQQVVAPLAQQIGDLWRAGTISAAQEHFASARLRAFLSDAARPFAVTETTPTLIVATPARQLHEMGAAIVAAAATNLGWRVTYLGASLPAAEIAGTAIQSRASAVALSIVYPEDDPALADELEKLRRYLPQEIRILAGGRAAPAYRATLDKIEAITLADLNDLLPVLDDLRRPGKRH